MIIEGIIKGDSIDFQITLDVNLTNYKIRAELFDNESHCIRLATSNITGGADTQILVTEAVNGQFTIFVLKTLTACFDDDSFLEVEIESSTGKVTTVMSGECTQVKFKRQKIDWETPS